MHRVGFEPTRLSPPELKSGPLDHSGICALHRVGFEPTSLSRVELESTALDRSAICVIKKLVCPTAINFFIFKRI